jgi:hypothetical protein
MRVFICKYELKMIQLKDIISLIGTKTKYSRIESCDIK